MRTRVGLGLALSAVAALGAGPGEAPRAIVEAAIRAHGGAEALARAQTVVLKAAGQLSVAGKEVPFAEEYTAQWPRRWRHEVELRTGEQKLRVLTVVNGDRAWQSTGGAVAEVTPERLKELREDGYARWLTTLLPLTRDPSLRLAPLAGAPGVKVSCEGHADVSLYFDEKTHLLLKMRREAEEVAYSGYKDFDGVQMPTRWVRTVGGKKVSEITAASYQFPRQVEEATFGKP
jgi:hypothetical protein